MSDEQMEIVSECEKLPQKANFQRSEEGVIVDDVESQKIKEQNANAFLRERFLRFLSKMSGKQVQIHLCEKIFVQGKFIAMQMNHQHYLVDQLQTPTGVVEHAALRMNDTISISVSLNEFNEDESL